MTRVAFFGLLLAACGGSPPPSHEVAQPLPVVTATEPAPPAPTHEPPPVAAGPDPRDPRPAPRQSAALLRTEAQQLESLLASTAANDPHRADLLFRIATDYVDLRRLGDPRASASARARYDELATSFPNYPKIDEVHYELGLENELAGDLTHARLAYYRLIRDTPQSRFVPYAYYAFGEMFRAEAKSDPSKWDFAQQAYVETIKFPKSPIAHEATCRLVEVFTAKGEAQKAASMRQVCGNP